MSALQQRLLLQARVKRDLARTPRGDDRTGPVTAKLDEIKALQQRVRDDTHKLTVSLALDAMWPGVFDGAKPTTTSWRGRPSQLGSFGPVTIYEMVLRVTSGKGIVRDFPQADVPEILWPTPAYGRMD
jgi:hypothetical protein